MNGSSYVYIMKQAEVTLVSSCVCSSRISAMIEIKARCIFFKAKLIDKFRMRTYAIFTVFLS